MNTIEGSHMRNSFALASLVLSLVSTPILGQAAVSYDSVMNRDVHARQLLFNALSATNKAEIINTHIQRWIARNNARLSPEQVSILKERMALVTDELSGKLPKSQETADRFNDLQRRTARMFAWEDMRQATSMLQADYIPRAP
jgi:hypothetical protein